MSNYLTNLVAKNLNQLEVVRPRLPSWFEPVSGAVAGSLFSQNLNQDILGGEVPTAQFELESQNSTSLLVEQQQRRSSQGSHRPPSPATERQLLVQQLSKQTDEQLSMPAINSAGSSLLSEDLNRERPAKQVLAVPSELEAPRPTLSREQQQRRAPLLSGLPPLLEAERQLSNRPLPEQIVEQLSIPASLEPNRADPEQLLKPSPSRPKWEGSFSEREALQSANQQQLMSAVNSAGSSPLIEDLPGEQQTAKQNVVIQPVLLRNPVSSTDLPLTASLSQSHTITEGVVPYSSLAPKSGHAVKVTRKITEPSQSAPTIQVTIGRIEVRANTVVPASSQPKPRPKLPVMSLEEYLHRRAQGGDR